MDKENYLGRVLPFNNLINIYSYFCASKSLNSSVILKTSTSVREKQLLVHVQLVIFLDHGCKERLARREKGYMTGMDVM